MCVNTITININISNYLIFTYDFIPISCSECCNFLLVNIDNSLIVKHFRIYRLLEFSRTVVFQTMENEISQF